MAMKDKPVRCECRRPKPARYLARNNPTGESWQKCGRVAVVVNRTGPDTVKAYCLKCAQENMIKIP